MGKSLRYGLFLLSVGILGYYSVYFEKLSEVRARAVEAIDFQAFADSIYYQGILPKEDQLELTDLLIAIEADADSAFEAYGNRLGIGNSAYFMVKCRGGIIDMGTEAIRLSTPEAGDVRINTRFIFGNALRDASGLVKLTDFKTNAEFNRVSEALNTLVRTKVIPPVLSRIAVGDTIVVTGAVKLSKKDLSDPALLITPAQIELL